MVFTTGKTSVYSYVSYQICFLCNHVAKCLRLTLNLLSRKRLEVRIRPFGSIFDNKVAQNCFVVVMAFNVHL